jgi:hypothetical protein
MLDVGSVPGLTIAALVLLHQFGNYLRMVRIGMLSIEWLGILVEVLVGFPPELVGVALVNHDVSECALPSMGGRATDRRQRLGAEGHPSATGPTEGEGFAAESGL